jgi:hypothetical protein
MKFTAALPLLPAAALLAGAWTQPAPEPTPQERFAELWRRPGFGGRSCSSCHSDSGREIWMAKFHPDHVRRRSLFHLPKAEAGELAELTRAVRPDPAPASLRPFAAPETPLALGPAEVRDRAFARRLAADRWPLASGRMESAAEARKAAEGLRSQDLTRMPVGLLLDPVSRDPRRVDGETMDGGPMLADWIADVAPDEAGEALIGRLSALKRAALLEWERELAGGEPDRGPIWEAALFARSHGRKTAREFGIRERQTGGFGVEIDQPLGLDVMALHWMWVGWSIDPSLSEGRSLPEGDAALLGRQLAEAGPFPAHFAAFASRFTAEQAASGGVDPGWLADVPLGRLASAESKPALRRLVRMAGLLILQNREAPTDVERAVAGLQALRAAAGKGADAGERAALERITAEAAARLRSAGSR